jgi:uncharacterized protein YcbK (DUF882 family)
MITKKHKSIRIKNNLNKSLMLKGPFSRRSFVKTGLITLTGFCLPFPARSFANALAKNRCIRLYNTHTDEYLEVRYRVKDRYLAGAMSSINKIMRDHRTGEIRPIEPRLIDFLYAIGCCVGGTPCFHIISGYRSPATNARLRKRGRGVAKKSRHMRGQAVDIRVPCVQTAELRNTAWDLRRGGVGYYAVSDFIHIDVGPVRSW